MKAADICRKYAISLRMKIIYCFGSDRNNDYYQFTVEYPRRLLGNEGL
jgi:hypothetical protein